MRIAIISSGRSARLSWKGQHGYATTIAVNFGITVHPCDHLCAGDADVVLREIGALRPRIALWTMDGQNHQAWGSVAVNRFDVLPACTGLGRAWSWTIQGALAVGLHLGARSIDIYGCDMDAAPDVAGRPSDYRTAERWGRESSDMQASIAYLSAHGCTVNRITPFPWEKP